MSKKEPKLTFIANIPNLKPEITINTIPQVVTTFKYVVTWANNKVVKADFPEDHSNVITFFKSIGKLSDKGFTPSKVKALWIKHNMEEICDYTLFIPGDNMNEDDERDEECQ